MPVSGRQGGGIVADGPFSFYFLHQGSPLLGIFPEAFNIHADDLFAPISQHFFPCRVKRHRPAFKIRGNNHIRRIGQDIFHVFLVLADFIQQCDAFGHVPGHRGKGKDLSGIV